MSAPPVRLSPTTTQWPLGPERPHAPVFRNVPRRSRSKIEGVAPPVTLPLIDHLALRVRDEKRSRTFYEQALEPFGVEIVESSRGPGFAIEGGGDFWIEEGESPAAPVHVAFAAADRDTVDKFHRAAVEAGGRTTARRVFARITTPGITQRSSLTRTGTTSKRSSTGTASCQPRDARLGQRSGMSPDQRSA